MTDKQPEALRLAERCKWFARTTGGIESAFVGKDMLMEAAAELRRLHEENAELVEALKLADELIGIEPFEHVSQEAAEAHEKIRAALAKATGENND